MTFKELAYLSCNLCHYTTCDKCPFGERVIVWNGSFFRSCSLTSGIKLTEKEKNNITRYSEVLLSRFEYNDHDDFMKKIAQDNNAELVRIILGGLKKPILG